MNGETVKCPGEVTFTAYAAVPDITLTVTPDFKYPAQGVILDVDLGDGHTRSGGSALSTVYNQLGDQAADVSSPIALKNCFEVVQTLLEQRLIVSGHDRSDGGLITTLCEMAFAGNCGLNVDLSEVKREYEANKKSNNDNDTTTTKRARLSDSTLTEADAIEILFSEELGVVMEVLPHNLERVKQLLQERQLKVYNIGHVTTEKTVYFAVDGHVLLSENMPQLRDVWESTSFALEKLQCNPACVEQERASMLAGRPGPSYKLTFDVQPTPRDLLQSLTKHRMAVIRQEGSNGDRELLAAFYAAGFEAWDVNMNDLLQGKVQLSQFRGIAFCGGFSYADVNDSAKGWAGVIRFNESLLHQFETFRKRTDTFSLGICNGCQLMALLGWVPFAPAEVAEEEQPRFIHNTSGRFESRFSTVQIQPSPAVLLRGMEGSTLGVWLAHGEGKLHVPNGKHMTYVLDNALAPLRYVNDSNEVTQEYPMNPNGSPHGIASLCSLDGRHLAMMPHPEVPLRPLLSLICTLKYLN